MDDAIRVLCVDADADFLAMTAAFIERHDIAVLTETSTRAAIERLEQEKIDCIVSDYQMPEMNGLEFLSVVRDSFPHIPFILFTGKGSEEIASEAISAGVTDYLQKEGNPDQYEVLTNRIENAVAKRRAERDLRRTESRYRQFAEQSIVGIYIVQNECIQYANPKLAAIFGYDRDELEGMSPLSLVAECDRAAETLAAHERGELGEAHYTFTGQRKDGTTVEIEVHGGRIDYEGDSAIIGVCKDVDDRRRREYTLRALHDATGTLMRAHSEEAVTERAVAAAEDVLGFSLATIRLYDPETERLEPIAATDATTALLGERPAFGCGEALPWRAFSSGEPILAGGSVAARDANDLPLQSTMYVPLDSHGTLGIGSADGEFTDSDVRLAQVLAANTAAALDRVAYERLLRERERERQNERLEEFASVVSHDLRNPLGVARGRLELANEENPTEHDEDIQWALSRMDSLIEDLLALARQGAVVDETSVVSLESVARAAWTGIESGPATLVVEDELGEIEADADRLARLFENLFRNAIEHSTHEVSVRVGRFSEGFFVADNGPGIPERERERVFESGYSTGKGTGLGLAIVRTIAEAHGWEVSISRSEAGGACFEVRI